jgi:hypothetical protein
MGKLAPEIALSLQLGLCKFLLAFQQGGRGCIENEGEVGGRQKLAQHRS